MRLPPPFNVTPSTWRQPLHTRERQRYVHSEKELRLALNEAIAQSTPSLVLNRYDTGVDTLECSLEIIIASSIQLSGPVNIPRAASGLVISSIAGSIITPTAEPKNATTAGRYYAFVVTGENPGGGFSNTLAGISFRNLQFYDIEEDDTVPDDYEFKGCIDLNNSNGIHIVNCRLSRNVDINDCEDIVISGCLGDIGAGLNITDSEGVFVSSCDFSGQNTVLTDSTGCTLVSLGGSVTMNGCATCSASALTGGVNVGTSSRGCSFSAYPGATVISGSADYNTFTSFGSINRAVSISGSANRNAFSGGAMSTWTETGTADYNIATGSIITSTITKATNSNVDTPGATGSNNR